MASSKLTLVMFLLAAFAIGFLAGVLVRSPSVATPSNQPTTSPSVIGAAAPVQFPIKMSKPHYSDFDEPLFRFCNQIPHDLDAKNFFLWARNTRHDFEKDVDDVEMKPKPNKLIKFGVEYMGTLTTDGDTLTLTIQEDQS